MSDIDASRRVGRVRSSKKCIYFVRHGATELNRESGIGADRIRGHIDVPLAEFGRQEANAVAEQLAKSGVRFVFSSDLRRAVETAEILANRIGTSLATHYGLRPWKLGPTIEGRPVDEVQPLIRFYFRNPQRRPPEGESFVEFKRRVLETLCMIERQDRHGRIAIVTHYRCLKLLEARTSRREIDPSVFLSEGRSTGSISILRGGRLFDFAT